MKRMNLLKGYSIIVSLVAIGLWLDNRNLNVQLDEEIEIKYEYSAIIDSLMSEGEAIRHWNEIK